MARVNLRNDLDEIVAKLPGVMASVDSEAGEIGGRANALLAAHRRTGAAHIDVDTAGVDATVSLVDNTPQDSGALPAVAIEYGHTDKRTGEHVEGLYVITKAAGFA